MGDFDGTDPYHILSRDGSVRIRGGGGDTDLSVAGTFGDVVLLPSGDTTGATDSTNIEAAIARVTASAIADGQQHFVRFAAGDFYFSRQIVASASNIGLVGAGKFSTSLHPGSANPGGGPDVQTNSLILSAAAISGVSIGTLTVTTATDDRGFTINNTPLANTWYLLLSVGNAQTGYPGQSFGAGTLRGEMVRVASVSGAGPFVGATFNPIFQWHGIGTNVFPATARETVTFADFDIDLVGTTVASGIFAQGVVGLYVDVAGGGASRMLVEAQYCTFRPGGQIYNRGGNNSPFSCNSSHLCKVENAYAPFTELGYAHPTLGIPRGVQYVNNSVRAEVNGYVGRCVSLEFKGLLDGALACWMIDCDFTERDLRDPNLFGFPGSRIGGVLMNCSNPASAESEVPINVTGWARLRNCRVPDPTGNILEFGALFVDAVKNYLELLEIANDGRDPNAALSKAYGASWYDTAAFDLMALGTYRTIGIEWAANLIQGGNRVPNVDRWEYDSFAGAVGGNFMFGYGQTTTALYPFHIGTLVMANPPLYLMVDNPGSSPINHDPLRDILIDTFELGTVGRWTIARIAHDTASGAAAPPATAQGDCLELVPARAVVLNSGTDFFTLVGHSFPNNMPVYIGGVTAPAGGGGFAFGDVSYAISSDFGTFNTTFQVSATIGGAARDFTTNGVGLTITAGVPAVGPPTTAVSRDKCARINGPGFGSGIALPVGYTFVAFGDAVCRFVAPQQVAPGDAIVPAVAGPYDWTVNNASVDPYGYARGKPNALAGLSQVRRTQ